MYCKNPNSTLEMFLIYCLFSVLRGLANKFLVFPIRKNLGVILNDMEYLLSLFCLINYYYQNIRNHRK